MKTLGAELIVLLPFVLGAQHRVGFADLFEFFLRFGVVFIAVGMVFHGQFPVSLFYIVVAGVAIHIQYGVIIFHSNFTS